MSKITLIGIDTAKKVFHLVGIDKRHNFVYRKKLSRQRLLPALAQLEACEVVLEACAASHHWARSMQQLGHRVRLIAPQHVKPYRRGQKNDYRDAEAIISAALAPGIHFVGVKSVEQQAEQALHRVRSQLLRQRIAAANGLRGLLGEYGLAFSKGIASLRKGAVDFVDSGQAEALGLVELVWDVLHEIDRLQQRLDNYGHQIEQRVRHDPISRRLRDELHGVGRLCASALRVKVADPRDYANGRNFSAYLGLAPGHRGTGGKVRIGKIRRGHDRYLRQLLIHGARSVLSHLGEKQDEQSRWLRSLRDRRGFNVASVALAHKNARQAWAILVQEQALQD
jgi:transposase